MQPTALVIGCTGQDGSYLCKSLLAKNYKILGTSRKKITNLENLLTLKIAEKFKIIQCDFEDFDQAKKIIEKFVPEEIYNLSAQSSVGLSFKEPIETHKSIVNTTINILEACRQLQYEGNIFLAGSSEIFGDTNSAATENTLANPESPYAIAKYHSLMLGRMYREIYQLKCSTGILFNHESPIRNNKFVIKKIIKTAIMIKYKKVKKLTLGNINIRRDWGWAEEYVEAMQLMNKSMKKKDYIICSGKSHSLKYLLEVTFQKLGLNWHDYVEISKDFIRSKEINSSEGNPSLINQDLGWKAKIKLEELIQLLINNELNIVDF